jgi:hypothetical protein
MHVVLALFTETAAAASFKQLLDQRTGFGDWDGWFHDLEGYE